MDLCEFKASLVYRAWSRTGFKVTQRNPVSKNQKEKRKENIQTSMCPHAWKLQTQNKAPHSLWCVWVQSLRLLPVEGARRQANKGLL